MDKILRDKKSHFRIYRPGADHVPSGPDHPDDTNGLLLTLRLRSTYTP